MFEVRLDLDHGLHEARTHPVPLGRVGDQITKPS